MSEMLDPKTLTPESLYKLQSDTWEQGAEAERERILKWIEENRSGIEFEPGEVHYRDHFNSESLIAFIKEEK